MIQNSGKEEEPGERERSEGASGLSGIVSILPDILAKRHKAETEFISAEDIEGTTPDTENGIAGFVSMGVGVAAFLTVNILIIGLETFSLLWCMGVFCSGLVFFGMPGIFSRWKKKRYKEDIERAVPDFLDLLVLSVDSGMTFDAGLAQCRKFSAVFSKALDKELEQLAAELRILPSRRQALESLVARTGSETLDYLTIALNQGEKYGTPIRSSLRTVAKESRRKRLIAIERKGSRLPVLLSIPLMLLILPPVVAISAGPGFISLLRSIGGS
ncbi:MAG: type II secretion system F family protein [Sneathiellales bacterium]|nr:type II secretion system F family protein [Sneathiellales bacterium]